MKLGTIDEDVRMEWSQLLRVWYRLVLGRGIRQLRKEELLVEKGKRKE